MNYPYRVSGGQTAFFSNFHYRFSDQELFFMRHAPEVFVQMGNADWFDHHGFQQADVSPEPVFDLVVRDGANRRDSTFQFMEPPVLEMKLTNISTQPQLIDERLLHSGDGLTVILKKDGKPARQYVPYSRACFEPSKKVLMPGESEYAPLSPSCGLNGRDLAEPGYYTVQVALDTDADNSIVSKPLRLRIEPPRGYEEELLAQDFFSDDVGRALSFGGTKVLQKANDTLREVSETLPDRRVAIHARVTLAAPMSREYKVLSIPDGPDAGGILSAQEAGGMIRADSPDVAGARAMLAPALESEPQAAIESLGHIGLKTTVDSFTDFLSDAGDRDEAGRIQTELRQTLAKRGVIAKVLQDCDERAEKYRQK
jgi:hypothetical protein